jgi:hypothetical protein
MGIPNGMAITAPQLPPAGDIPLLPTPGVTPESFQILRAAAAITALRQDRTPRREILLHHGHRAPVTLLHRVPIRPRQIQGATQAAAAVVEEGDNNI